MSLPIADLTRAKTPEQAAAVVRSWTKPTDPEQLDPLDLFVTRGEMLAILRGEAPEWADPEEDGAQDPAGQDGKPAQPDTNPEDSAPAQAGSAPATAGAQSEAKPAKRTKRKPAQADALDELDNEED